MVEKDAVGSEEIKTPSIVDGLKMGIRFSARVGRLRVKRGRFSLRRFEDLAIHFAAARLIHTYLLGLHELAGSLEHIQCADANGVQRIDRLIIRNTHVTLRAKVVDLVGLNRQHKIGERLAIRQIAVVQPQVLCLVSVFVQVIDALRRKRAAAADHTVHPISFVQQDFREVASILAGDSRDECSFSHLILLHGRRTSGGNATGPILVRAGRLDRFVEVRSSNQCDESSQVDEAA